MSARAVRCRRAAAFGATLAVLLALMTGCGREPSPVEAVPGLDTMLSAVDEAMAARRYGVARTRINALVEEVQAARQEGDLDEEQADRILAASAELLSALPSTAPRKPSPSPKPSPTATSEAPAPAPTGGSGSGSGGTDGGGGATGGDPKGGGSGKADNPGKGDPGKGKGGGGKPRGR